MEITPEIQAEIDKATKAANDRVTALEGEKTALTTKNTELLNEKKGLQSKLSSFGDLDAEAVAKLQQTLETSEEARLLSEGKVDEVINARVEKYRLTMEEKLNEATSTNETLKAEKQKSDDALTGYKIKQAIQSEAIKSGVSPEAMTDVINRASGLFGIDEDGQIMARDSEGHIVMIGKDKNTPLTPENFMKDLKEKAPHFWPSSKGGGLNGSSASDFEDKLDAAANSGDMKTYRKLREQQRSGKA